MPERLWGFYWVMAKKSTQSNVNYTNKMRAIARISDNVISGGDAWDYSFILLMGGCLKEAKTGLFYKERHEASRFSAWLAEETMKRIYRFKFSKCGDEIHTYVKAFLADHQFGKLKRWIHQRVDGEENFLVIKTKLLGDYDE